MMIRTRRSGVNGNRTAAQPILESHFVQGAGESASCEDGLQSMIVTVQFVRERERLRSGVQRECVPESASELK